MRKNSMAGVNTLTTIDTLPSSTTTYTDLTPLTPLDSNLYQVEIVLSGSGCTSTARTNATRIRSSSNTAGNKSIVVVAVPVSVNELFTNEISISPNPSSGIFTISINNNAAAQIRVFDILGNEVLNNYVSKLNHHSIDLSRFANGFYECRIVGEHINVVKKLVKN